MENNKKILSKKMILFFGIIIIIIILCMIYLYKTYYSFTTISNLDLTDKKSYQIQIKSLYLKNNSNQDYTWNIENENIAIVSTDGIITPIQNGKTILTIKSKKGFNTKKVVINISGLIETNQETDLIDNINNIDKNDLMISDIYITVGSKQKINIDNIKLESYSKNIIEVDNSNVIKAINIGETIVKATAEDEKISYFKVIVTNKDIEMIDILLNKSKITLNIGDTEQLKATLKPINATNIN